MPVRRHIAQAHQRNAEPGQPAAARIEQHGGQCQLQNASEVNEQEGVGKIGRHLGQQEIIEDKMAQACAKQQKRPEYAA